MKNKSLVIVESPAKAKTINKILGSDFLVKASMGHIKDLPANRLGVKIKENFEPDYVFIKGRKDLLKEIKKTAEHATSIYLAPDPDREGEMICWHLQEELNDPNKKIYRIMFNEITEKAIKEAVLHPGEVDVKKVNAQQARRVLDRIVGYMISPLLWKKVRKGLSAGRVQSVAVRLICDREKEIENFVPVEYWEIEAELENGRVERFLASLDKKDNQKLKIEKKEQTDNILNDLKGATYAVADIDKKKKKKSPLPPFITSKLQQEAVRKLGFTPQKTMLIAQQLYEGLTIENKGTIGLITYMRTDSTRVAAEAIQAVREYIEKTYGVNYLPEKPNYYKTSKLAQEAHEAIRPTMMDIDPDLIKKDLTADQYKLYNLIWKRFIASQMTPQMFDVTSAYINAKNYTFIASGSVIIDKGFTIIYEESIDNNNGKTGNGDQEIPNGNKLLPILNIGEILKLINLNNSQHFTKPPARYNEATIVKTLEENGIGRPSTYATIITTIQKRGYVEKKERVLFPTDLGKMITDLLVTAFPHILDVEFTANMENSLDEIEEGHADKETILRSFYDDFSKSLDDAKSNMRNVKKEMEIETEVLCENCGKKMVVRWGRHGKFLACPGFPDCKNTKPINNNGSNPESAPVPEVTNEKCDKCGSNLVIKTGRFGKFLACSKYPECKTVKPFALDINCPKEGCTGKIVERRSKKHRFFYGCSNYPNCNFISWDKPVNKPCPECKNSYLVIKQTKKGTTHNCPQKECNYKKEITEEKS